MNKKAKYKNIINRFKKNDKVSHVILLYFFEQTKSEMAQLLTAFEMPNQSITIGSLPTSGFNFLDARTLGEAALPQSDAYYCLEVHPLFSLNEIPILAAEKSEIPKLTYFVSMDEPALGIFNADKIVALMKQMGVGEDEELENKMITKSIMKGQQKLEKQLPVVVDVRTSQEDWLDKNPIPD